MRVLQLSLRNYRVFEELDLELPARVIGIFGENGSGKSTLMESIAFACYGVDATRTKKQQIRTHGVLTDCEVRLVFEHAGLEYDVRRTIRGRGHAPEAQLYGGDLILASGVTDVDAEIARILHMDLRVFRASAYAEQKQLDAFSEVTTGRRKEMALRLLGIKPVDDARGVARRQARATKESAEQLGGAVPDLAALEAELKDAKEAVAEASKRATKVRAERVAAAAAAESAAAAFAEIESARERVARLTELMEATVRHLDERVAERDALAKRRDALERELASLSELVAEAEGLADAEDRLRSGTRLREVAAGLGALETQLGEIGEVDVAGAVSALERVRSAHAQAQTAAAAAQAELEQRTTTLTSWQERVERAAEADPSEPCPSCGRPLGEDFSAYRKHCRAEAAAAKKAVTAATKAVATSRREVSAAAASLEEAATAAEDARRAHERRTELTERAQAMRSEVGELAAPFGGEVPDADELRARSERARAVAERIAALEAQRGHLDRLREDLASSEERVRALQGDVEALTEEAGTVAFDAQEHAARSAELDRARDALEAAERTLGETADAAREAELRHRELAGAVRQATETAARVQELRSDARYVGRVALLLDGFRDHLVARVGPELSREAEALFRELTNREYDDLKVDEESLAIQIADGETYFPLDRFSGSETDLANLALRVAISTHLSRVSGADVGLLVLDEVLGSLDEERKDLMVRTLGSLSSRFHQVFVITHAERVKDQFPASILVRKVGRRRSEAVLV